MKKPGSGSESSWIRILLAFPESDPYNVKVLDSDPYPCGSVIMWHPYLKSDPCRFFSPGSGSTSLAVNGPKYENNYKISVFEEH